MGIEPASMTAVFCHNAPDRTAETWKDQLGPFASREFAVSDAARGIAKAVAEIAASRREDVSPPASEHGLDIFPTTREAHRALARHWRRAEAKWEQAEAADEAVAAAKRRGIDARGVAQSARAARAKAIASSEQTERSESARDRARSALDLFGPDGRLNDRARAESVIAAAVVDLTGPDWAKVRNPLSDPRSLAVLDRMHRRLETAEPRRAWREALAWRWWLRHCQPKPSGPITDLIPAVGRGGASNGEEQASYDRVAAVLWDTYRASSAVECLNRVLRMQQSRHRRMRQPMPDLERLDWNCRPFRSGPRQDAGPYPALGLDLPTFDFWEVVHTDPARLTQELSTQGNAE